MLFENLIGVIKKSHAKIIIEFYRKAVKRDGKKMPTKRQLLQESYFSKLRLLNTKNKLRLQRLNEGTPKGEATV